MIETDNIFEERAENLSREELESWTTLTKKDLLILHKLQGPGAKLLTGPRGCGKSTLMRLAYFRMLAEKICFPVYVNYSRSLALEPLFHSNANAPLIFRQWLLAKIAREAGVASMAIGVALPPDLRKAADLSDSILAGLEKGEVPADTTLLVSPIQLISWLEQLCADGGFKRVVLLLDDAAHAFSSDQQSDFFEVFRQLKTRQIAPKAAVYPGITTYSPNFHIGHEAEQLNAWYDADDPQYLASMRKLLDLRLPPTVKQRLDSKKDVVELLALAAFGIPRGFLGMLSTLVDSLDEEVGTRGGWAECRPIVEGYANSVRKVFRSLAVRLPKFRNFVTVGEQLSNSMIEQLRRLNATRDDPKAKTTTVGIEEPLGPGLERVLHMLEYSGVVRDVGAQTRGEKGSYRRFEVHHALVSAENALALGRSFTVRAICDGLAARDPHVLVRIKASSLAGQDHEARCTLSLTPCPKCGTDRTYSEQRFCMKCGTELRDGSVYDVLLTTSIGELPLPQKKIDGIIKSTTLRTVNDVLADDKQQLLNVPYVGPTWAKRIRRAAEEFVSV